MVTSKLPDGERPSLRELIVAAEAKHQTQLDEWRRHRLPNDVDGGDDDDSPQPGGRKHHPELER